MIALMLIPTKPILIVKEIVRISLINENNIKPVGNHK